MILCEHGVQYMLCTHYTVYILYKTSTLCTLLNQLFITSISIQSSPCKRDMLAIVPFTPRFYGMEVTAVLPPDVKIGIGN